MVFEHTSAIETSGLSMAQVMGWHALAAQPREHVPGEIMPTPLRGEGMPPIISPVTDH